MLGLLSVVLCCYSQNLSAYQWMYLQVQTYVVNFFFFVLKSEACLQTASSSKVRLSHRVILQSSAGLQVPQKVRLCVFTLKVSCDFDIVFCMNDFYFIVDYPDIYIRKISVINYIFSCFLLQLRWGFTVRKCKIMVNKGA